MKTTDFYYQVHGIVSMRLRVEHFTTLITFCAKYNLQYNDLAKAMIRQFVECCERQSRYFVKDFRSIHEELLKTLTGDRKHLRLRLEEDIKPRLQKIAAKNWRSWNELTLFSIVYALKNKDKMIANLEKFEQEYSEIRKDTTSFENHIKCIEMLQRKYKAIVDFEFLDEEKPKKVKTEL